MSGYYKFSKSNNAIEAERENKFPATIISKKLKIPVIFIKSYFDASEWHHSSKFFNKVMYYDLNQIKNFLENDGGWKVLDDFMKNQRDFKKIKKGIVYNKATVRWLEWSGTKNYHCCKEMFAKDVTVIDKGGDFVRVVLQNGKVLKKKRNTKGFEVWHNSKRMI